MFETVHTVLYKTVKIQHIALEAWRCRCFNVLSQK